MIMVTIIIKLLQRKESRWAEMEKMFEKKQIIYSETQEVCRVDNIVSLCEQGRAGSALLCTSFPV